MKNHFEEKHRFFNKNEFVQTGAAAPGDVDLKLPLEDPTSPSILASPSKSSVYQVIQFFVVIIL